MTRRLETDQPAGDEGRLEAEGASLLNRRSLLAGAASMVGTIVLQSVTGSADAATPVVSDDPTRVPGKVPTPYGQRSTFETATRMPRAQSASLTPLQDSHGILTPSALHFERHHNGVPTISPAHHRLLVHGLVDQP